MRILNMGSLNLDRVYDVRHFVTPGETILAQGFGMFCGGKGLNQSVALARAGAQVYHAGAVGAEGEELLELLRGAGADVSLVCRLPEATGHAIIQLEPGGQNSIIVYGGANQSLTSEYIERALAHFTAGDLLLVQNETSGVAFAMQAAKARGMLVAFNASPITPELFDYPLHQVDYFLINEVEGRALAGAENEAYGPVLDTLRNKYEAAVVLTVGSEGAYYQKGAVRLHMGICDVPVVDTTAAGDTFCGYFIASLAKGMDARQALEYASRASSLAVSRKGAANSIPEWQEVETANLTFL